MFLPFIYFSSRQRRWVNKKGQVGHEPKKDETQRRVKCTNYNGTGKKVRSKSKEAFILPESFARPGRGRLKNTRLVLTRSCLKRRDLEFLIAPAIDALRDGIIVIVFFK